MAAMRAAARSRAQQDRLEKALARFLVYRTDRSSLQGSGSMLSVIKMVGVKVKVNRCENTMV